MKYDKRKTDTVEEEKDEKNKNVCNYMFAAVICGSNGLRRSHVPQLCGQSE
jgi:hypothetical protein